MRVFVVLKNSRNLNEVWS